MKKQARIAELFDRIRRADHDYWTHGVSDYSDDEYFVMCEELRQLTGVENQAIGSPTVFSNGKVTHPETAPMLSMDKAYQIEYVISWIRQYHLNEILIMPKYDGVALVKYQDGTIATRGNGAVGENVTAIARHIAAMHGAGYGECVCPLDQFAELEKLGYINPRSTVSGILNSANPELRKRSRYLEFVPYRKHMTQINLSEIPTKSWANHLQYLANLVLNRAENYPVDGVVFRVADDKLFQTLGNNKNYWYGQIALKFKNMTAESTIEEIYWQETNGRITPMARFTPVLLNGATLSRGSLYNLDRLVNCAVKVGDLCTVERSGGSGSHISAIRFNPKFNYSGYPEIPSTCPSCGLPVQRQGAYLYCPACAWEAKKNAVNAQK